MKRLLLILAVVVPATLVISPQPAFAACQCVCSNGTQAGVLDDQTACNQACGGAGNTCGAVTGGGPTAPAAPGTARLENPLAAICPANVQGQQCVQRVIGSVIRALLGIVGSIALLMIIYGGFLWLTSQGNSERIQKGKSVLVWAVMGLALIFAAYAITSYVIDALTTK